jgi:circadian clock protein KaiA
MEAHLSFSKNVRPRLMVCLFLPEADSSAVPQAEDTITRVFPLERFSCRVLSSVPDFKAWVEAQYQEIDCLVLKHSPDLAELAQWLQAQAILLPAVILHGDAIHARSPTRPEDSLDRDSPLVEYHSVELHLSGDQLERLPQVVESAITQFINLAPSCDLTAEGDPILPSQELTAEKFRLLQQRRLGSKLKERLGYLGVYYKRSPKLFLRNLSEPDCQETLFALSQLYRQIVLDYFSGPKDLNQQIDQFVNLAFFADMAVSQVVELHMTLMDEFATQLKLEGRSDDILLDYRLTLIDILAHLCEMYRRSIPREDA